MQIELGEHGERRAFSTRELRMSSDGKNSTIRGTAARFNIRTHLSTTRGRFQEIIREGAFDKVLRTSPDVVCLLNHDANQILGRTTAGTLRLSADSRGLNFECDLPNTSAGRDTREGIKRGDINGCSFAFNLESGVDDEWYEGEDTADEPIPTRQIRNFSQLLDVSPVTFPAYAGTGVALD